MVAVCILSQNHPDHPGGDLIIGQMESKKLSLWDRTRKSP
jgi:hypothetical protein